MNVKCQGRRDSREVRSGQRCQLGLFEVRTEYLFASCSVVFTLLFCALNEANPALLKYLPVKVGFWDLGPRLRDCER